MPEALRQTALDHEKQLAKHETKIAVLEQKSTQMQQSISEVKKEMHQNHGELRAWMVSIAEKVDENTKVHAQYSGAVSTGKWLVALFFTLGALGLGVIKFVMGE